MRPGERQRERRTLEPLLEPRREQADDAGRPCFADDDDRRAAFFQPERHERFRLGLGERSDLDLLPDAVEPVELDRNRARFKVVCRGEEPDPQGRIANASARIDARADEKAQVIWPRRSVRAGDVEQGRKPRTAPLAHDCEPLDDKGAVEPDQRDHVGDGRERHEIERGDQVRGLAPVPEARLPQRPVQRDERHIDDPGGAEIAEPGKIVLAVGIDQRQRMRQRLRSLVMIEHDHVKAEPVRELEGLAADSSAIDRHDELGAFVGEIRYRLGAGAIALRHAVGDVDDRFAATGVEIFAEERGAARAVDVVIAEDGDTLAARRPPASGARSPPPYRAGKKGLASGRASSDRDGAEPPLARRRARRARGQSVRPARRLAQWRGRATPRPR